MRDVEESGQSFFFLNALDSLISTEHIIFADIFFSLVTNEGKSTLLAALRGKLPLLEGKRIENEKLRYVSSFLLCS